MGWNNAVITNSGLSLIAQAVSGGTLAVTSAGLGGGTVETSALMAQTKLTTPLTVPAVISAKGILENGLTVRVQIRNTGVTAAQRMKQVGLFAKLSDNDPVLFAIMQDDTGEEIPPAAEYPDFMIEFTAAVAVSNTDNILVTISSSAVITRGALDEELKNYTNTTQFNALSSTVSELGESKADKTSVEEALNGKSDSGHTHDERYYTKTETNELLDGKSNSGHTHDDRYYTEFETNNLLNGKADSTHTHTVKNISDFPSSLPANGGNADTLDGKHASDFKQYYSYAPIFTGNILDITEMGTYSCSVSDCTNLPFGITSWCFITMIQFRDSGYKRFICTNLNNIGSDDPGMIYLASESYKDADGNLIWSRACDGGNADTANSAGTLSSTPTNVCLRNLSSGTADVTTTNCPSGAWYGQHS